MSCKSHVYGLSLIYIFNYLTLKWITCVSYSKEQQLPPFDSSLKCKCIHDPCLYKQEAINWEAGYITLAIRISQHLLWWCSKVIRKTKMPLSTSHDFHTILPAFHLYHNQVFLTSLHISFCWALTNSKHASHFTLSWTQRITTLTKTL